MADEPNPPGKPKGVLGDVVKAETMIQLAIALPAACVVGWLAGAWADKHFGTHWIGIAGIVLGAVAGFVKMITAAQGYIKKDE